MRKYSNPGILSFIFIPIILVFTGSLFSQMPATNGYYHIYYNHTPDTVYLDGKPVTFQIKKKYPVAPGVYTIKAVANCYYPIEKQFEITPGKIKLIKFKFKHLTTPEKKIHTWLMRGHYFVGVTGIAASLVSLPGRRYALPLNLIRLGQHFLWNRRVGGSFDSCTNVYSGSELKRSAIRFFAGISSAAKGDFAVASRELIQKTISFPGTNYTLRWDTRLKVAFNPNSNFLSNYALNLGAKGRLFNLFSASVTAHLFPFAATEIQLDDSLYFYRNTGSRIVEEKSLFFLVNYNLHIAVYHKLDQTLSVSLGGYSSNTVRGSAEVPLSMPEVSPLQDSTATTTVDYEFQAEGVNFGIHYNYYLKDRLSLYFDYNIYFNSRFVVNEMEKKTTFFLLNAGVSMGI